VTTPGPELPEPVPPQMMPQQMAPQSAPSEPTPAIAQPGAGLPPIAPGPGVIPPFAVPPREGHGRRLGIGITIGAVVFVLCCGGGAVGFGALLVTTTNQRLHDARTVVTSYMNDWRKRDFTAAYQLLCSDERDQVTVSQFADSIDDDTVVEFSVESPLTQANEITVPVHVSFDDGSTDDPVFVVVVDKDGSSRVCGTTP
jgi:hypothetical protein